MNSIKLEIGILNRGRIISLMESIKHQGFEIEYNVWWVHKDVNRMKMDLHIETLIRYCELIVFNKENIRYGHDE